MFSYKIKNPFIYDEADCVGFYARRRTEAGWEWYCKDKNWHLNAADMPEKMLLSEKTSIKKLCKNPVDAIWLVVQWESKKGIRINAGHRIFANPLMAHAFGGMDGKTYHNTLAAFEHGMKEGYKNFEIDLSYTTDDRLVLSHGWTEANCKCTGIEYRPEFANMTYEDIMNIPVHGNPIMDARQFYQIAKDRKEHIYEIDFHNVRGECAKRVNAMLADFEWNAELFDRLLVQVYNREMYEEIDAVYHFKYYMYLVGKNIDNLDSILTFCMDKGICALALRANLVTPEFIQKIHNAGLYVFCYTIQKDICFARWLLDAGVDTICTDFITESQLESSSASMGRFSFYVWYNSNHTEAQSRYSLEAEKYMERTPNGNLEYKDADVWSNTGKEKLRACRFIVPGEYFVGWKLRIKLDGKDYWYGTDHLFHTKKDFSSSGKLKPYIFQDEERMPVWTVKKKMKLVMVAVWKKQE